MTAGLRLDAALRALGDAAADVRVAFTSAPRRAVDPAASGEPACGYVARVVRERPGELICAWFYEPQPGSVEDISARASD